MPEGIDFPYHFGFIPGTLAEDGDLMDVLVLIDELNFSGCEGDCTMVGVMQRQKNYQNDRLIATSASCLVGSRFESARVIGMSFFRCA